MNIVLNKIRETELQNRYAFGFGDLKNKVKNIFHKNKDEKEDVNQSAKDIVEKLPDKWKRVIDIPNDETVKQINICDTYTVYSQKHFCLSNKVGDTNTSDTIVLPYLSSDFPQGVNPFESDNMDKKSEETTTGTIKVEFYLNSESGFNDLKDINMNVFGTFDMGAPYQFHKEFTVEKCKGFDQIKNFITDYNQFSDNLMSWSKFEQISNWVMDKTKKDPNNPDYVFDSDVFTNVCRLQTKYKSTKEIEQV